MPINQFSRLLHNPKSKPHKMNIEWPLSIAVEALREASHYNQPAQEPNYRPFFLTDRELEFIARAISLVD